MNTVELIKGEIKRLKEYKFNKDGWTYAYQEGLNKIEKFINSLQEEPKFKTGDKVIYLNEKYEIADITDHYILHRVRTAIDGGISVLHLDFDREESMELVEEPVSEELEKAADKYSENIESDYSNDMFGRCDIFIAFIAGAEWQKQQIEKNSIIKED